MFLSTHIVWGGLSSASTYNLHKVIPVHKWRLFIIALFVALSSHFLLDAIPHNEYNGWGYDDSILYAILIPEGIFTILLLVLNGCDSDLFSTYSIVVLLGGFLGALPDAILMGSHFAKGYNFEFFNQLNLFHLSVHSKYRGVPVSMGTFFQLCFTAIGLFWLRAESAKS